jgi:hypothetical protein
MNIHEDGMSCFSTNLLLVNTFTFLQNVHYPDSYMVDMRFDLLSNVTASGDGIAYITG